MLDMFGYNQDDVYYAYDYVGNYDYGVSIIEVQDVRDQISRVF